jgi:succinate dehydrogenase/fumarate reductase cytochrome b subunit
MTLLELTVAAISLAISSPQLDPKTVVHATVAVNRHLQRLIGRLLLTIVYMGAVYPFFFHSLSGVFTLVLFLP